MQVTIVTKLIFYSIETKTKITIKHFPFTQKNQGR